MAQALTSEVTRSGLGSSGKIMNVALWALQTRTSGAGGLMLAGVMFAAALTHPFVVGGSPLMAMILLVVTAVVAWGRRQRTLDLLAGLQ